MNHALPNDSRGSEGQRTPPSGATDCQAHTVPFDPLSVPITLNKGPPSPPSYPPPPQMHPNCPTIPSLGLSRQPDPAESGILKVAAAAGRLQDVHQILSQYLLSQSPDTTTGRIWLGLFHESIMEAIANQHPIVLSYLFFMRVGEPSLYVKAALRAKSTTTFQVFLDYGWNINESVERTMSPVLGYVSDDTALTEWFLDHGADPNAMCAWDYTPMSEAMYRAPSDTIEMLFQRGGDIGRGQLLHNAVLRNNPDVIELVGLLIDMGADVNEIQYKKHPQSFGERFAFALGTPLHYAAEEGRCDLVLYLISRGADPSIKNTKGRTVIETAEHLQQSAVVQILCDAATNQA